MAAASKSLAGFRKTIMGCISDLSAASAAPAQRSAAFVWRRGLCLPKILITDVRVIPWQASEKLWGVAVTYSDGRRHEYRAGSHAEAVAEAKAVRADPSRNPKPPKGRPPRKR